MIKTESAHKGWICFTGAGRQMLRFSDCIEKSIRPECFRRGRYKISVAESALFAALDCFREFKIDISSFSQAITIFQNHEMARKEAMKIIMQKNESGIPPEWNFLKSHQKIAVNSMTREGLLGACLFDEQGTGKTLTVLAAFDILKKRGHVDCMIVVAPQSVLNSWRDDSKKIPSSDIRISVVAGNRTERETALRARADIFALGYDALDSLLPVAQATAQRDKCLLVADEAFLVKNPRARRSHNIQILRKKCVRAFVLSGTPAPRNADDIIHQTDIADNGYTFQGYKPTGELERDADKIYRILSKRSVLLRRKKDEVLPLLPPKEFNIISVAISGRQQELYLSARKNLALYLRNMNNQTFKKELANYFQRRAKLLQLCGCPPMVDKMFSGEHAKIQKLDSLISDIVVRDGGKAVIWTSYTESILELAERYQRHGLVSIYGKTPEKERKESIEKFQNDKNIKIFLGNPAAAGAGITLHAASDSIYMSYSDKAAEFIQSIDRTHRIGQTAAVVRYHFLICENTVEVNQIRLLYKKMLMQHVLFQEEAEWPKSVEDALEELKDE